MAPRIIESPDELTNATVAIEKNMRAAVGDEIPDPEPLRPVASPVDTNQVGQQADSLAKMRMVTATLQSAVGATESGIAFFDNLRRKTIAEEKNKVGAAVSAKEVIDTTPGPLKWIAKAMNPFIGQGAREQFGENLRVRVASAFESARLAENARRIEVGEKPMIEPAEVLAFAQDYFDEAMLGHENGNDPDFQRGFRAGIANEIAAIGRKQEGIKLQRILNDAYESIDQSAREATDALLDADPADPINPGLLRDVIQEVTLNSEIGLDDPDALAKRTIQAVTGHLLERARTDWRDLTAPELDNIRANLMEAAGANSDSRAAASDGMQRVVDLVASKQIAEAKGQDSDDDIEATRLKGQIQYLVSVGDSAGARSATLALGSLTLEPGKADQFLTDVIDLHANTTGVSPTRDAIDDVIEFIDTGPTSTELHAKIRAVEQQYGVVFTREQLDKFRNDQDSNERNRTNLRGSPAYRLQSDALDAMAKRAGEVEGFLAEGFSTLSEESLNRNKAIREIKRSWNAAMMDYARAHPDSVRANDDTFQAWMRKTTDDHLKELERIATTDPDAPDANQRHNRVIEHFRNSAESRERAKGVFMGSDESRAREMQSEADAAKAREDALNQRRAEIMLNATAAIDAAFPPGEPRDVAITSKAYAYMLSGLPGNGLPEDALREAGRLLSTIPDPNNPARSLRDAFDEAVLGTTQMSVAARP